MMEQQVKRSREAEEKVRNATHQMVAKANMKESGLPIPASPFNKPRMDDASPALQELVAMLTQAVPNNVPKVIDATASTTRPRFDFTSGNIGVYDTPSNPQQMYEDLLAELYRGSKGLFAPTALARGTDIFQALKPRKDPK